MHAHLYTTLFQSLKYIKYILISNKWNKKSTFKLYTSISIQVLHICAWLWHLNISWIIRAFVKTQVTHLATCISHSTSLTLKYITLLLIFMQLTCAKNNFTFNISISIPFFYFQLYRSFYFPSTLENWNPWQQT